MNFNATHTIGKNLNTVSMQTPPFDYWIIEQAIMLSYVLEIILPHFQLNHVKSLKCVNASHLSLL